MGISGSKLFIVRAIAQNEASPARLIERLDELQSIVGGQQEYPARASAAEQKDDPQTGRGIVLSTVHSSKGLEYDTVYLMDVVDGVFPESIPKSMKAMGQKERAAYEEERRLFYVGVTRARDRLLVFRLHDQKSSFCRELTFKKEAAAEGAQRVKGHKNGAVNPVSVYSARKKTFSNAEFGKFLDAIGEGLIVKHRKLGEGVVVEIRMDKAVIRFGDEQRLFELKALYEYDLLIF